MNNHTLNNSDSTNYILDAPIVSSSYSYNGSASSDYITTLFIPSSFSDNNVASSIPLFPLSPTTSYYDTMEFSFTNKDDNDFSSLSPKDLGLISHLSRSYYSSATIKPISRNLNILSSSSPTTAPISSLIDRRENNLRRSIHSSESNVATPLSNSSMATNLTYINVINASIINIHSPINSSITSSMTDNSLNKITDSPGMIMPSRKTNFISKTNTSKRLSRETIAAITSGIALTLIMFIACIIKYCYCYNENNIVCNNNNMIEDIVITHKIFNATTKKYEYVTRL